MTGREILLARAKEQGARGQAVAQALAALVTIGGAFLKSR